MRASKLAVEWLALAVVVSGCLEQHAPTEIADDSCVTCHRANYRATTAPPHPGRMPTTCADCHIVDGWQPALAADHPTGRFPLAGGAHAAVACLVCHQLRQGASTGGANTDCLQCHSQAENDPRHTAVPEYAYAPAERHFCLSCHPAGTAGRHPESAFPIASGPHRMPCADCHRSELGASADGANTDCTGCHTGEHARNRVDAEHREVGSYQWSDTNPHFCLRCHPRGREDDD